MRTVEECNVPLYYRTTFNMIFLYVCEHQSWSCGSSVAVSLRMRWFWQCRTARSRWGVGGRRWTPCWSLLNTWATERDTLWVDQLPAVTIIASSAGDWIHCVPQMSVNDTCTQRTPSCNVEGDSHPIFFGWGNKNKTSEDIISGLVMIVSASILSSIHAQNSVCHRGGDAKQWRSPEYITWVNTLSHTNTAVSWSLKDLLSSSGCDSWRPGWRSHTHPPHSESDGHVPAPHVLSHSACEDAYSHPQGRDFPWSSCSKAFCWLPVEKPDQRVQAPICCLDLLLDCFTTQVCWLSSISRSLIFTNAVACWDTDVSSFTHMKQTSGSRFVPVLLLVFGSAALTWSSASLLTSVSVQHKQLNYHCLHVTVM